MNRRRSATFAVASIAALAVASTSASGATRHTSGTLSYRLAAVASRSFAKASPREQAKRLSLPARGAGSLLRDGNRYVVEVRVNERTAATARRLGRIAGASVIGKSSRYRTVTVAARASALRGLAHSRGVAAVTEQLQPMTSGPQGNGLVCQGAVTSEGLAQLHADTVQNTFGVTGAGVKVGVLSDSYDRNTTASTHAADDIASGDLPGPGNPCGRTSPVQVLDDSAVGHDEGRAMLQVIHDLAPNAALAFATAFNGETNFASNIQSLANAGAKVIADDVTYFDEPFFQDGPVAVAVNNVTNQGVTYFSSAANNNLIDSSGRNIASWEAPAFRDSGTCPAGLPAYATHCLDFNPGPTVDNTFGITVSPGATLKVDLQWAQPWNGVTTDLDAYIANAGALSENDNVSVTQKPFEFLAVTNTGSTPATAQLAIDRCNATCAATRGGTGGDNGTPRVKVALLQNGGGVSETEYPASSGGDTVGPTIFGHNGALNAMSTAAVPFSDSNQVESYSSRGPVTQYFGPVNGTTPAPPISPTVLNKPDIAATDCASTTFFGPSNHFCGTSEAAPHAAAVAALELQQNPSANVVTVKSAQITTASPVDSFGHEAAGAGLVNATAAVQAIDAGPPGKARITKHPKKRTRSNKAKFKFSAAGAARFQCKIDKKPFKRCASPKKLKVKKGKRHSFQVRGVDNIGKVGPASKKFKWKVLR